MQYDDGGRMVRWLTISTLAFFFLLVVVTLFLIYRNALMVQAELQ